VNVPFFEFEAVLRGWLWWDEIGAFVDVDFGGNAGLFEIFTTRSREFNADSFVISVSKLSYTIYRNCTITI
jgi:hypothetical protein